MILGADVIYETRLVPLVADVLDNLLAPGGLGLIASPYRVAAQRFPAAVAERALICDSEAGDRPDRRTALDRGRSTGSRARAMRPISSSSIRSQRADDRADVGRLPASASRPVRSSSRRSEAVGS